MRHNFIPLLIGFLMSSVVHAQMTNVYVDDQFSLSRIYAGFNSTTLFATDSMASYADVNFRIGIKSSLKLNDQLMFKTWGAIQISKNQPVAGYNSFELMLKPTAKFSWHVGLIATPTTVLRPNPTTWESQVETYAQSTIIPGRPGTKVAYVFSSNAMLTYGYFNHGKHWAHHLNITIQDWCVAGYRLANGEYFTALRFNRSWFENTITYSSREKLSISAFVNVKNGWSFLIDTQYMFEQEEVAFLQTGIRKYIRASVVHVGGFFGLTYDWKTEMVIGQLFIHLS
ncbi:MAG: hypothetical protein ABJO02_20750 [Reichenbachiella sp.]|uniref:hypothetical protein n=1 Tax=Reichenbachiella sp. TaxID=2184521 RepID=UPI003296B33A